MALPSSYNTGTATVAAGGTAVTGQGTSWSGALRAGDLFGTHKGLAVRIASVNSNTSLTLAYPWPGAAQTAAAYEVQIVPDEARVQEQTRLLLEKLANGNLEALAGLNLVADRLPFANGNGSLALATFTAFARSLLDDGDPSTARATLELVKQSTPQDGSSGRILEVGSFGLGTADLPQIGANDMMISGHTGFFAKTAGTSAEGFPFTDDWAGLQINRGGRPFQIVFQRVGVNNLWFRVNPAGTPSPWRQLYHSYNVVGPVAQSGGLPTGMLIERGSNSNGDYARWADGTQICWIGQHSGWILLNNRNSGEIGTEVWTYPAAFTSAPPTVYAGWGSYDSTIRVLGQPQRVTNRLLTSAQINWETRTPLGGSSCVMDAIAIGRWF